MYAAAGGASLASRQARRKIQKHHTAPDVVHQQFQKRFNQLQAQHAPASADHYNQRQQEQLLGRLPDNCRHFELKEPFPLHKGHDQHLLRTAPVGLHSRLPSYVDLNGRITGFGSSDISEVGFLSWIILFYSSSYGICLTFLCLTFSLFSLWCSRYNRVVRGIVFNKSSQCVV